MPVTLGEYLLVEIELEDDEEGTSELVWAMSKVASIDEEKGEFNVPSQAPEPCAPLLRL